MAWLICPVFGVYATGGRAQENRGDARNSSGGRVRRGGVRSVTIPVTINPRGARSEQELVAVDFTVTEDNEEQSLLSVRGQDTTPLSLAILIQDDLISPVSNEIPLIADFIRRQPRGTRVLVGYLRAGSLQVRQRFTTDLERAAGSLRIPVGSPSVSPYNPYVEIIEALKRFESLPLGRRAIIVVSDGLDVSRGVDSASPSQSLDLQRAINEAQRRGVAVYSLYAPTVSTASGGVLVSYGQGSLNRISDETGGRAFFQGTNAPVSFDAYFKDLSMMLKRQIALTYLSTHPSGGFHRISVTTPGNVEVRFPAGYIR
ncbi:MAG: hypothetical protein WKF30_00235 [Pyrinomonadaceae bacterium]